MAEIAGDGEGISPASVTPELSCSDNNGNARSLANEAVVTSVSPMPMAPLTVSGSFKEGKSSRRRASVRPSMDADEFINLLHGSDPVKVELNRLENEVRGWNVIRSISSFQRSSKKVFDSIFGCYSSCCLCRQGSRIRGSACGDQGVEAF